MGRFFEFGKLRLYLVMIMYCSLGGRVSFGFRKEKRERRGEEREGGGGEGGGGAGSAGVAETEGEGKEEAAAAPSKIAVVIVSTVDGKTANVKVPSNMPVNKLLQNCVDKFQLPHSNFAVMLNGAPVEVSLSLADAGLSDGCQIDLVPLE